MTSGSRKSGYTLEDHKAMGAELSKIHNDLVHRITHFANAHPKSHPIIRRLEAALKAVDEVRDKADDLLFWEHPKMATSRVYYPGGDAYAEEGPSRP